MGGIHLMMIQIVLSLDLADTNRCFEWEIIGQGDTMEYIDVVQKWSFFKETTLVTEETIDTIDTGTAQEDQTYKQFSLQLTYLDAHFVQIQIFCMTILAMNTVVTETVIETDTETGS